MSAAPGVRERVQRVVAGVVAQALADAGAGGLHWVDADSPESTLARSWCAGLVPPAPGASGAGGLLGAHSATKTTLLLAHVPPAAVYPLGDLYGSELIELGGDWEPPPPVRALADSAGGAAALDAALRAWAEERRPLETALRPLPGEVARLVRGALEANRFTRRHPGLVPKLTARTLGIDLWE